MQMRPHRILKMDLRSNANRQRVKPNRKVCIWMLSFRLSDNHKRRQVVCNPVSHSGKRGTGGSVRPPLVSCTISTWFMFPVFPVEAFKTPQLLVLGLVEPTSWCQRGTLLELLRFSFSPSSHTVSFLFLYNWFYFNSCVCLFFSL